MHTFHLKVEMHLGRWGFPFSIKLGEKKKNLTQITFREELSVVFLDDCQKVTLGKWQRIYMSMYALV